MFRYKPSPPSFGVGNTDNTVLIIQGENYLTKVSLGKSDINSQCQVISLLPRRGLVLVYHFCRSLKFGAIPSTIY